MVFGPVNDPLTTRGHFAAVIDGRCPSRGSMERRICMTNNDPLIVTWLDDQAQANAGLGCRPVSAERR